MDFFVIDKISTALVVLLNAKFPPLGPGDVTTAFDPTPCAVDAPAGTFTIRATFANTSADTLSNLFFEVAIFTGGNVLCNASGGPGGEGSILTVPLLGEYADGELGPGESFDVEFDIGLASLNRFTFFVDLLGAIAPRVQYVPLVEGNPGIPGDGVIVSSVDGLFDFAFELQPPFPLAGFANGLTVSAFPPRSTSLTDLQLDVTFLVVGRHPTQRPLTPCSITMAHFGSQTTLTVNGVQGIARSMSQQELNQLGNLFLGIDGCEDLALDEFVLHDVSFSSFFGGEPSLELDALAVGIGENVFPTETTPPPE